MSPAYRLGVYGGTFSPPHNGHVAAARAFVREAGLDKLLIMPAFCPPHKAEVLGATTEDRFAMAKLAFADVEKAEVSDLEIRRGGVSYTSDTLTALSAENVNLYLLCGTDMFLTLDAWHDPETIFRLATACYVRRQADASSEAQLAACAAKYREKFSARTLYIPGEVVEISSSELRAHLNDEAFLRTYLPAPVYRYIIEKGLYQ